MRRILAVSYTHLDVYKRQVLGLDETGAARCTARVFADAPGVWHAGRIAVQRGLRGQGVGRLLLVAVADKARAQGARTLELGAQYDKQGFYAVSYTHLDVYKRQALYCSISATKASLSPRCALRTS